MRLIGHYTAFVRVLANSKPTMSMERALQAQGHALIAGVDEVGRGSLAGPVVAAAVILPVAQNSRLQSLSDARDSKSLTPEQREELSQRVRRVALGIGIGSASHFMVDELGIATATRRAMLRAVRRLPLRPDALLIDAFGLPQIPLPQVFTPKGDTASLSVAAASIIAKVTRDQWMQRVDARWPEYGFARHKGYATGEHCGALQLHGPCPLHRRSFAPISALVA